MIRKLGRGRPLAEHLKLGSLNPSSVSVHAFHPLQVHQPLQEGTQAARRRRSSMWQWQVLPSASAKHQGTAVAKGHLQYRAPGDGFDVSLASGVSWPWQLPFGSSLVMALWSWPFLSGRSYPAFLLRPIGPCPLPLHIGESFCDSLPLEVPLWQPLVGGSFTLVALLRQFFLGGLLASGVPPDWLVGDGSFLPGILPTRLSLCSALLVCLLPGLHTSPALPHYWVGEAIRGVGPRVHLGLGPSGFGAWCGAIQVHPLSA